jgi:hypothetical protein
MSCKNRNYDYYRRFFQLKPNYYYKPNYFANANENENYYDKTDAQAPIDIKSRNNSTLCFPPPLQMKTNAIIGPSGAKLTKQQKWAIVAKGGKLCKY